MPQTMNSNQTSLTYAEEVSLKVLAGTPTWYPLEPNSYQSFGGDLKTIPREPINASRQRKKGTVTDLDVKAGFNHDFTQQTLTRILQGFFFAAAREKASTIPINGTAITVTGVTAKVGATPGYFSAAAGLTIFPVNAIVLSTAFGQSANNNVVRVTTALAAKLSVAPYNADAVPTDIVAEAAPPANAKLKLVGVALSGDVKLYGPGSNLSGVPTVMPFLSSAATLDFTTLGLIPGEWVYIGDTGDALSDTSATEFNFIGTGGVRNRGYCRIYSISAHVLTFDICIGAAGWALSGSGDQSVAVGTSGYVSMYFGTVIRNEPLSANIVRRTYTLQRYLGLDGNSLNSLESISGAVPDQLTLNVPANNKITADMSFVAMDTAQQHAASLAGNYAALVAENAFNTSSSVFSMLLYLINPLVSTQTPLFAYATDAKITINNNTKPNKAIGVVGAFEANVGNFDVSGSLTCYFDDIAAQQAVRNNANVGLSMVLAKDLSGVIFDLPLLTLALNGLKVEKDKPIMADITHTAAPGAQNYTALFNAFDYLPASAMAAYSGL